MKKENCTKVKLIGGSRDGERRVICDSLTIMYITKRITIQESQELMVNSTTMWSPPEEIYERLSRNEFVFTPIIHYKPEKT